MVLMELGVEEVPARFMVNSLNYLDCQFKTLAEKYRVSFENVTVLGTYRRLAIEVDGVSKYQKTVRQHIKGPPKRIAWSEDKNEWLPAGLGFAKKQECNPNELRIENIDGTDYVVLDRELKGKETIQILPELLTELLSQMPLPIAMKWGEGAHTFMRAVHWIVALADKSIIPFEFLSIPSGCTSFGHRFLTTNPDKTHCASGSPITINDAHDYQTKLLDHFVRVNHVARQLDIQRALEKHGVSVDSHSELLNEVNFLTEWPTVIVGTFPVNYCKMPAAFIIECMKHHQKYFPIRSGDQLTNQFAVVAENVTDTNRDIIRRGNERVLNARLADVHFFWEQDKKINLEKRVLELDKMNYQRNAGTIKDKVLRMTAIATEMCEYLSLDSPTILRTIYLAKADLMTQIVGELSDLQGYAGARIAESQGEPSKVVEGILNHYQPINSQSKVPVSEEAVIASLVDKWDGIVIHFREGLIPTGSQDPFSLRRSLIGCFRLLYEKNLKISIKSCIEMVKKHVGSSEHDKELEDFVAQRLITFLTDKGIRYDIAQAFLMPAWSQPLAEAIDSANNWVEYEKNVPEKAKLIVESAVRIKRLSQSVKGTVEPKYFDQKIENTVWKEYKKIKSYSCFELDAFWQFSKSVEEYFDQILIMHENETIKKNRLKCLQNYLKVYENICEFDKLVISSP